MARVYADLCEKDGKNFNSIKSKSMQEKVRVILEADGYVIQEDGTVVKEEEVVESEEVTEEN